MNADEIKRLREIADRCPRGPWNSLGFDEDFTRAETEVRDPLGRIMARVPLHRMTEVGVDVAEMIARLDPQTVLVLLDRLDALEAENAMLRAVAVAVPAVIAEADRETVSFQNLRRALAALAPSDSSGARKESQ